MKMWCTNSNQNVYWNMANYKAIRFCWIFENVNANQLLFRQAILK